MTFSIAINHLKTSWLKLCILLLCTVCVLWMYHHYAYIGHYGYDDMEYARLSNDLMHGHADWENHFFYRTSILVFTAIAYALFGVSDFASALPALLCTLSIVLIVLIVLMHQSALRTTLAVAILVSSQWFIFYTDKLMPDIYIALSVMLAAFAFQKSMEVQTRLKPIVWPLLFIGALAFGFMSKLSIILILPWLVVLAYKHIRTSSTQFFWKNSIVLGLLFLTLYLSTCHIFGGSAFSRFYAILDNGYLNSCSYDRQPLEVLLHRLGPDFFTLLLDSGLALPFVAIASTLLYKSGRQYWTLSTREGFYLSSAGILLLSANFMSITPLAYIPMCLDVRHFLYLLPIAAIPASRIVHDSLHSSTVRGALALTAISAALVAYFIESRLFLQLYLPFALWCVTPIHLIRMPLVKWSASVILAGILVYAPYQMVGYARHVSYGQQKAYVKKYLLEDGLERVVLTNRVQKRLGEYYTRFDPKAAVQFLAFNDEYDRALPQNSVVLRNRYTENLSNVNAQDLPYYADTSMAATILYAHTDLGLQIFEPKCWFEPLKSRDTMVVFRQSFDTDLAHWSFNESQRSSEKFYSRPSSARCGMYSPTLFFTLDSSTLDFDNQFIINLELMMLTPKSANAFIVLAIEKGGEATYRFDLATAPYEEAQNNWFAISGSTHVLSKTILTDPSTVKVYVYNPEEASLFIDDFRVWVVAVPEGCAK